MHRHTTAITVGFTSFTTLLFELVQTRILSYIFWDHVVYLTVSLALLGFGISGTLVALFTARNKRTSPRVLGSLLLGYGITTFGAVALTAWLLPQLSWAPAWAELLFCYVVYVIPFIFAGAILSLILSGAFARVGFLYSVDLLAAGLGCLLFFFLLPLLGAPVLVMLLAVLSALLVMAWVRSLRDWLAQLSLLCAVVLLGAGVAEWLHPAFLDFVPISDKEMGSFLNSSLYPHAQVEHTTWTPISRIDVTGDDQENLWGYGYPKGLFKIITQDGTAHTRLPSKQLIGLIQGAAQSGQPLPLDGAITSAAYQIEPNPSVAIIGVGGGIDVANALASGARSVYGMELNPATYNYASNVYADYNGHLFQDPRVTLVNGEGRNTLRSLSSSTRFDAIQVIAVDTFAALSSGAYVLSENYLYTVEAFQDMFAHLQPNGVLAFYRWLFSPPRETLRLSSVACEAWRRQGLDDCDQRIMVIGQGDWALSLFKNSPYTPDEVRKLAAYAASINQTVLYWPKVLPPDEQQQVEGAGLAKADPRMAPVSQAFNDLTAAYRNGSEAAFFAGYQYNVAPTTDDSPFFFEYTFLNGFGLPRLQGGFVDTLRGSNVSATLYLIMIEATVLSLLAIFWPLWRYQRRGLRVPHAAPYSLYFAALGFGFMMIEIGMTQKAVLFLGNPLYALPVVLATLLLSAGIGSGLVARFGLGVRQVTGRLGLVFLVLLALLIVILTPLFQALLPLAFPLRVGVVVLALAPLGVLMGTFFPSGLRLVGEETGGSFVPWAWGINGCLSVYGSVAAILVAMVYGFNVSLALGGIVYAGGFMAARWFSRPSSEAVVPVPVATEPVAPS